MTLRHLILSALTGFALLSCSAVSGETESPEYAVERADESFEIRRYEPQVYAEVTTAGTRQVAANAAFRQLAAYIFDKERPEGGIAMTAPVVQQPKREAIAMTAPVVQSEDGAGEWTMAFTMPSKWTLATLPKPENPNITLREEPAKKVAVVQFSGRANPKLLTEKEANLRDWMAANDIAPIGPAEYAFYDPPWTPAFMRRNEVVIPVE